MNVLVIDYTGESEAWLKTFGKKELNIISTIVPNDSQGVKKLESGGYDAILIFESGKRDFFSAMAREFEISDERIVFALDIDCWLAHKWAIYALINEESYLFGILEHLMVKDKSRYTSCTIEDVSYIGYSSDVVIMREMSCSGVNWSKEDMEIFHGLATNFYDLNGRKYFLDIGANIGTTSIYFQRKIDKDIKVLAFEPDPETYKLLRVNFILNDMPYDSTLENCGLAAQESEMLLHRDSSNPGANSFLVEHNGGNISVRLTTVDAYLAKKNIRPDEIKYIWIDTEGFEAQVFFGMRNLIATQNIPIFLEWNPSCYVSAGVFEDFVELIINNFAGYIDVKDILGGNIVIHKITDLWNFKDSKEQTNIFLLKQ